jgi:CRISPR-associated protein Cmr5
MARFQTTGNNPTTHSERAQWAWDRVTEANERGGSTARGYATQVRKLPARLQVNGLGQTLAFLYSKSRSEKAKPETGERLLLCQLGARIAPTLKKKPHDLKDPDAIMKTLVAMIPDDYRRCTHELMATAEWLKRFADGLFDKSED